MSRCLVCAHWKPYAILMDTNGVRSAGLLPKESHDAIIEQRTNRILLSWKAGLDGAYTKDQLDYARQDAARLYTGTCRKADSDDHHRKEPHTQDALFKACDGHDSEAWLETHETFGCIQFEQATPDQLGTPK